MSYLETKLVSHSRKVCSFYKLCLRHLQSRWIHKNPIYYGRLLYRYQAVLLRQRFDENKDIKDYTVAKQMLIDAEKEFYAKIFHPDPLTYPNSPGGCAFDRVPPVGDSVLDHWHPSEKAMYADYFARRDIRKREYIERWQKKYGKPSEADM